MAAELWINDSGVARQVREIWINDSGVARRIQEIWVNDSGVARQVFASDVISISNVTAQAVTTSPTAAVAQYRLENDGDIGATSGTNTVGDIGDWITPKTNMASYECRATMLSGSLTTGTTGAWINLATTRTWTVSRSGVGTNLASMTLEIRRASDGTVMDSATISFIADVGV